MIQIDPIVSNAIAELRMARSMHLSSGMKIHGWNGSKVAVSLREVRTTSDVFWSKRSNSFVLVESTSDQGFEVNGKKCRLVSINGGGEIRWEIMPYQLASALRTEARCAESGQIAEFLTFDDSETVAAARHFGLT